jgi:membrane associated rhomboid family serine protease
MIYELALISILLGAGYWGVYFVRARPHGTATFGVMQLGAAALAGLGLVGRYHDGAADVAWLGVAGAIGVGAGVCLLVVGPIVRVVARRLVVAERPGVARRLLDIAEVLAPGSGVAEEKAVLRAMTEIREGRIEQTVEALTAAKDRAPAGARLAIDERIAMLFLAAHRWSDAIAHAEAHLFGAPPPDDGPGSLRRELGVAPPVWVELVGAYGRIGELDKAAQMVARLEDVCTGRDDAALWIHRARMMFLALAGRIDAVRALVAPRQARHMSAAARSYWLAVAHEHRGDRGEAAQAYERARALSRGRPRELIDQALAGLGESRSAELGGVASDVVARIEASPLPPTIQVARTPRPRATWLITAALLAVSAITTFAVGETSDVGVLMRAGALVRGAVDSGEWWRLVSCLFIHVGTLHLILNAVGLVILGRLAEELFGSARTVALFGVAGVAGALASYLAAPAGLSAGASGAVFGLLGAVLVELTWHRERYRAAWKRGLWGGLAVVAVGQLGYGFIYPVIDQWAHGAGLAAGAVMALALSPNARWSRAGDYLGRAIALAFVACALTAGVLVWGTTLADSLAAGPYARHDVGGVVITAPASWRKETGQLFQPDQLVVLQVIREPARDPAQQIASHIVEQGRRWKDEYGELNQAREPVVALPDGWEGSELEAAPEDAMGYRQRVRMIVCGRVFGDTMVIMVIQVPGAVATAAAQLLAALIASTEPAT